MTTVDDFGEYTGVFGSLSVGGVPLADVEYDVRWSRGTVSHSRASKYSKVQLPGSLTVKTTIKKMLVHSEAAILLGYSLTDTSITGTATACLAATTFTAGTAVPITSDPATVSVLKITQSNAATTLGGSLTVVGTDANDNPLSESIEVAAASPDGTVWYTTNAFKTADYAITNTITGTAKFQIDGVAATVTHVVHNPKIFDLVGAVTKSGKSITITQPDCWFVEGGLSFIDADTMLEVSTSVEMHDPDLLTLAIVG